MLGKAAVVAVNPHRFETNSAVKELLEAAQKSPTIIVYTDSFRMDVPNRYVWQGDALEGFTGVYDIQAAPADIQGVGEDITKLLRSEKINTVVVAGDVPGGLSEIIRHITAPGPAGKLYTVSAHGLLCNTNYENVRDTLEGVVHVRVDSKEPLRYVA